MVFNRQCWQKYISLMCNLFEKLIIMLMKSMQFEKIQECNSKTIQEHNVICDIVWIDWVHLQDVCSWKPYNVPYLSYLYQRPCTYHFRALDRPSKLLWRYCVTALLHLIRFSPASDFGHLLQLRHWIGACIMHAHSIHYRKYKWRCQINIHWGGEVGEGKQKEKGKERQIQEEWLWENCEE